MRWLFLKDLQILRRSPFLVVLLVAYPVIIAVLIGLVLYFSYGYAHSTLRRARAPVAESR